MLKSALLAFLFLFTGFSSASTIEKDLIKKYSESLFKIQTFDSESDTEIAYGTGFAVDNDGYLLTNYHVVSEFILNKESYELIAERSSDKKKSKVKMIGFDMVNDLALLKVEDFAPSTKVFRLGGDDVDQGTTLYSMGNPHRVGAIIVTGTHNGILDGSSEQKINFTGSINSGMSGGPTINANEDVVGVNVETGGNGIGFLVNVKHAFSLYAKRFSPIEDFKSEISNQVSLWSKQVYEVANNGFVMERHNDSRVIKIKSPNYRCSGGGKNESNSNSGIDYKVIKCSPIDDLYIGKGESLNGVSMSVIIANKSKNSSHFNESNFRLLSNIRIKAFASDINHCGEKSIEEKSLDLSFCIYKPTIDSNINYFSLTVEKKIDDNRRLKYLLETNGLSDNQNTALSRKFIEVVSL